MEFFLTAQNKSIHIHNLSKIANILRTQACTLRKSIYDKAYDKSQVLAISTLEHFKGQRNCLTMPWRWFPIAKPWSMCQQSKKKCQTAAGYHQCPGSFKGNDPGLPPATTLRTVSQGGLVNNLGSHMTTFAII